MVEETVEYGGGDSTITVEDGSPLFEGFVGGKYDRTAFVALADDLEEQVGSALVVSEFSRRRSQVAKLDDGIDPSCTKR